MFSKFLELDFPGIRIPSIKTKVIWHFEFYLGPFEDVVYVKVRSLSKTDQLFFIVLFIETAGLRQRLSTAYAEKLVRDSRFHESHHFYRSGYSLATL